MSKDFAVRLKRLRKDAGITQEELARVLNVGRSTISEYERGVIEPKRKTLVDLAFYFGVPIEYFFIKEEIINTNTMLKNKFAIQDKCSTIQDTLTSLEHKTKNLSEHDEKIILEMLKNIIKIIDLL